MGEKNHLSDRMRPLRRLAGYFESTEVRWFGRSVLSLLFGQRVLVLETTGRTSGRRRRTTLAYRELGGDLIVVGGAGGQSRPPDWVANLRADPNVAVMCRRRTSLMTAHVLVDEERQSAWDRLLPDWATIAKYQDRAGYLIPVVMLMRSPSVEAEA